MPEGFYLDKKDRALADRVFKEVLRQLANTPSRPGPGSERSWVEAADHQSPEVYVAKATEEIPPITLLSGTSPQYDQPGKGNADVYQIIEDTPGSPQLRQVSGVDKALYNIGSSTIGVDEIVLVMRTKYGKWIPVPTGGGKIGFITDEDHPGQGIPFNVTAGVWNPAILNWEYDVPGAIATTAIDWRYNAPQPDACATGLGFWMPAEDAGTGTALSGESIGRIIEVWDIDCVSPGCATGTGG